MSYRIVTDRRGKECFRRFFPDWRTVREVSEDMYPKSTSKTIPLVSKYFNEFLRLGYLEEREVDELVRRGDQEYPRKTRKLRGNLKPFLQYAKAEKKVVFERLEGKMLADLVDNPFFLSEYLSINFREHVVEQGADVVRGLKNLLRDSIIYCFFVDHVWSRAEVDIEELEVAYPKNDFYELGKMLTFDEVLYTKVVLTVFDPPLDSMMKLYPRHYIIPPKRTGLLQIPEIHEAVHDICEKAREERRKELPEVYERFQEETQRRKERKKSGSRHRTEESI